MRRLLPIAIASFSPQIGHSHHNSAAIYDQRESISIEGTVIEYRFVNPHARVYFEVPDENGDQVRWMAEGQNPAILRRRGWTGEEMKPGDEVRITGSPSRDGSPLIEWHMITLANGKELTGGNREFADQGELIDRLERQRRTRLENE